MALPLGCLPLACHPLGCLPLAHLPTVALLWACLPLGACALLLECRLQVSAQPCPTDGLLSLAHLALAGLLTFRGAQSFS